MEPRWGIEPQYPDYETGAFPLCYPGVEPQRGVEPRSLSYQESALPLCYKGLLFTKRARTTTSQATVKPPVTLRVIVVQFCLACNILHGSLTHPTRISICVCRYVHPPYLLGPRDRNRTCYLRFKRPLLYLYSFTRLFIVRYYSRIREYPRTVNVEPPVGIEPTYVVYKTTALPLS